MVPQKLKILHKKEKKNTKNLKNSPLNTYTRPGGYKFHLLGPLAMNKKLTGSCPINCHNVRSSVSLWGKQS